MELACGRVNLDLVPNNDDLTQDEGTTGQFLGEGEKRTLQLALKFNF